MARHLFQATVSASIVSALLVFALYLATSFLDFLEVFDFLIYDLGLNFILLLVGIPVFLRWIRKKEDGARLSHVERKILDGVAEQLDRRVSDVWDQQVQAICKVDRAADGTRIRFNMHGAGRNPYLPLPLLPDQTAFVVATARLTRPDLDVPIAAKVWCESGRLSSIEYVGEFSRIRAGEFVRTEGWNVVVDRVRDFARFGR